MDTANPMFRGPRACNSDAVALASPNINDAGEASS